MLYREEILIVDTILKNNGSLTLNVRGDITRIYALDGNLAACYTYDVWGNCKVYDADGNENNSAEFIGNVNPFRYRGYYYDFETRLYFCGSRYYDPEVGRWINADDIAYLDPETINGLNLYSYCGNNPVMNVDPNGNSWVSFWNGVGNWFKKNWVKLAVGAAVIVGGAVVTALTAGTGAGFMAAFGAALLTSAKAVGISMAISAGIGAVVGGITAGSWEGALGGFGNGLADGFMWGGIFAGTAQILSGTLKITRNLASNFNGKMFGKIKLWSPNSATNRNIGGTLIKFGKVNRLDVEAGQLLHMHLSFIKRINKVGKVIYPHIPIGTILSSIIGGLNSAFQSI